MTDFPCCDRDPFDLKPKAAALRAARSLSEQVSYAALNAENTMLHEELTDLRARFVASQLALGQAVRELERALTFAVTPVEPPAVTG